MASCAFVDASDTEVTPSLTAGMAAAAKRVSSSCSCEVSPDTVSYTHLCRASRVRADTVGFKATRMSSDPMNSASVV